MDFLALGEAFILEEISSEPESSSLFLSRSSFCSSWIRIWVSDPDPMNPDPRHWPIDAAFHIIDCIFRVRRGPRRPGSSGSEESGGSTRAAPPPLLPGHTRNISDQSLPEEEGEGERMRTDHHHRLMEAHREEMSELRSVVTSKGGW